MIHLLFAINFLLCSHGVGSELTESELISVVRRNHPAFRAAQTDLEFARSEVRTTQGAFDPLLKAQYLGNLDGPYDVQYTDVSVEQQIGFSGMKWLGGYRRGIGNYPIYDEKMRTSQSGEARFGLEVPLLRNRSTDERRLRNKLAESGARLADNQMRSSEQDLLRQALFRYWEWVTAKNRMDLTEHLLKIAKDRDSFLRDRVKAGDAARLELLDNQRVIFQREGQLVGARRGFEKSALELSLFLWTTEETRTVPKPESAPPFEKIKSSLTVDEEYLDRSSVRKTPDAQIFRLSVEQRSLDLEFSRNQILPKLDLTTILSKDYGLGDSKQRQLEWRAGVTLEFPLFFNTAIGKKEQANVRFIKSDLMEQLNLERMQNQRLDFFQALHANLSRLRLQEEELALSLKLEDLERDRFYHGDSSILILNLREQATLEAEQRLADLFLDLKRNEIDVSWSKAELGQN